MINKNSEEGFQDIELNITEYWNEQDYNIIKACGQFEGHDVGLIIAFKEDMIKGINAKGEMIREAFYRNGALFYSLGKDSNNLIDALAKLYSFNVIKREMTKVVPFTCFAMDGNPSDFQNELIKFKLFFDENDEWDLYCEIYLNIDLQKGLLELKEKDHDYRFNILKALTSHIS